MHVPEVLVATYDFRHTVADGCRYNGPRCGSTGASTSPDSPVGWACMVPSAVDLYAAVGWLARGRLVGGVPDLRGHVRPVSLAAGAQRRSTMDVLLISAQTGAGLAMVGAAYGMTKYLCGITLVIVAGELPYVFSRRVVWIWVAAQCAVLTAIFWNSFSWLAAVSGGGAFAASHVFNVGQSFLRQREQVAREQLGRANAELQSTQELLAENSRVGERLRISRDLPRFARASPDRP